MSADSLALECHTCKASRHLPRPSYPVRITHSCDLAEPNRGLWLVLPEGTEMPTGVLP